MKPLKVLLWNLQDFFIFLDKYKDESLDEISEAKWQLLTASFTPNKPLEKVQGIRDVIEKTLPDICLFTEVGGHESLENFNHYFLNSKYKVYSQKSNSDRGIDLGILIDKKIPYETFVSFLNQKAFARGVYHLRLDHKDKSLHFLLTHLKSKLSKGHDFEGRSQRQKEVEQLIKIYNKRNPEHKQPMFICGDLNGIIYLNDTEAELAKFANILGLHDIFEHLNQGNFERTTYLYYNTAGDVYNMQLDYFLVHSKWKKLISKNSKVLDFDGGNRETIPGSRNIKLRQPSDHYPVYLELDLKKYWS